MALESGIAQLVEAFIAAGRPSSRAQDIDDRRAGYIASTVLAGETEMRVQVDDIEIDAMTFRVVSPLASSEGRVLGRGVNSDGESHRLIR